MTESPSVLKSGGTLYPLAYPWAFDYWEKQQNNHWMPKEAPLGDDVNDFWNKLTVPQRNLVTQVFRLFTKSDEEIASCYNKKYKKHFLRTEVSMMLTAFENIETVHFVAYAHLLQTLGLPEVEFLAFQEYDEMKAKLDFLHSFDPETPMELAEAIAAFSAATEGMSLFASFAILMNFPRHNLLKGMGDIIAWSIRDESMHCEGMAKLFQTFVEEKKDQIDRGELDRRVQKVIKQAVSNEDKFIDLAFELGPVEGLSAAEMKLYIRFIANLRYNQLGFEGKLYEGVDHMPLPWLPEMLNAAEFGNFFESRVTDYAKASTKGEWDDDAYDFD
jgi:ribonucleoside-diphosphate reductase beta chain